MKNFVKLILIALFVFGGIVMISGKPGKFEPIGESAIINTQSQLYVSNCARCHGADGKGNTQLGREMDIPDLTTGSMSTARMTQVISKGAGDMPAFGKKLKAKQIASLVRYVKRLK